MASTPTNDLNEPQPAGEDIKQVRLQEKTRKSLIEKLDNWEDRKVWDEFYQTYWRLIFSVASKSGLTREESFDVVQETILAIARQVQKGQYDPRAGSFKAWLLQMTRWRILDVFRGRKRQPSLANSGDEQSEIADHTMERLTCEKDNVLERIWDKEWQDNILAAALDRVKKIVSANQFQIFDCYVIKGWGVGKTAEVLGINTAQVYLAKHRVGALLKKEVKALEDTIR
jgi:RNA polymerase sigma factor (sigma-70 family)